MKINDFYRRTYRITGALGALFLVAGIGVTAYRMCLDDKIELKSLSHMKTIEQVYYAIGTSCSYVAAGMWYDSRKNKRRKENDINE